MWNRKLIKNKLVALALIGLGVLAALPEGDITVLILSSLIAVSVFFSKKNVIT